MKFHQRFQSTENSRQKLGSQEGEKMGVAFAYIPIQRDNRDSYASSAVRIKQTSYEHLKSWSWIYLVPLCIL
jgi:hypothetical protein